MADLVYALLYGLAFLLLWRILITSPRLALWLGLAVAVAGVWISISYWQELRRMPSEPERVSLSQISALGPGEERWVEITDARWDCQNLVHYEVARDTWTNAVFTDETQSIVGVATSSDQITCGELEQQLASGVVSRMGDADYTRLSRRGLNLAAYQETRTFLMLNTAGGRGNSRAGITVGVMFAVLGLALYPLSLRMQRHQ